MIGRETANAIRTGKTSAVVVDLSDAAMKQAEAAAIEAREGTLSAMLWSRT